MEQITRRGDGLYYGTRKCGSADEAYRLFCHGAGRLRPDFRRRKERIHGFGFDFGPGVRERLVREARDGRLERYADTVVKYRILGITGVSYCRSFGIWDMPDVDEADMDDYIDWLLMRGNRMFRLTGRKRSAKNGKRTDRG